MSAQYSFPAEVQGTNPPVYGIWPDDFTMNYYGLPQTVALERVIPATPGVCESASYYIGSKAPLSMPMTKGQSPALVYTHEFYNGCQSYQADEYNGRYANYYLLWDEDNRWCDTYKGSNTRITKAEYDAPIEYLCERIN